MEYSLFLFVALRILRSAKVYQKFGGGKGKYLDFPSELQLIALGIAIFSAERRSYLS
tara:strand:+ start:2865 stop:3035 length:171 start_codon:yes stop_codon:yes gene_type:complete